MLTLVAAMLTSATVSFGAANLNWGYGGIGLSAVYVYQFGTTTPLPAGTSGTAGLVQLIYLGANKSYDGFVDSGPGTVNDDVVVQTAYIGFGTMGGTVAGQVVGVLSQHSYVATDAFIMRVFDTHASTYTSDPLTTTVPGSGYFSLSGIYALTGSPTETFNPPGGVVSVAVSNPVAVPEPSTIALMLAGLGVLAGVRMRRK